MARRVAIVTGSSRGIGRAIAERLGADGLDVIVNYRSDAGAAAEVVTAIEEAGGRATAVGADITRLDRLREVFDAAERHYGGIDVVVSNVGIARFAPVAEFTDDDYDTVFTTNALTTFRTLREAANRVRDGGRIVVVSSGVVATHSPGTAVYGASKAAGDALVRVLAGELGARRVTVNSVLPGAVNTDALHSLRTAGELAAVARRTPLGRLADPGDIAGIVSFLTSDDARWVTGQTVNAGGGLF